MLFGREALDHLDAMSEEKLSLDPFADFEFPPANENDFDQLDEDDDVEDDAQIVQEREL